MDGPFEMERGEICSEDVEQRKYLVAEDFKEADLKEGGDVEMKD